MKWITALWCTLLLVFSGTATGQVSIAPYGTYNCTFGNPCYGYSMATPHPQSIADYQAFMARTTGDRQVYIQQIGNSNNMTVQQTGGKNQQIKFNGTGNNNTVEMTQNSSTVSSNILNISLNNASNNVIQTTQDYPALATANTNAIYMVVANDGHNVNATQRGLSGNILNLEVSGGAKSVITDQNAQSIAVNSGHSATIIMNGPAVGSVNMIQNSATHKNINILMQCVSIPCSVGINQTGP